MLHYYYEFQAVLRWHRKYQKDKDSHIEYRGVLFYLPPKQCRNLSIEVRRLGIFASCSDSPGGGLLSMRNTALLSSDVALTLAGLVNSHTFTQNIKE